MIARLNRKADGHSGSSSEAANSRPKVNYFSMLNEQDPVPDPSLLDPIDSNHNHEIKTAVDEMKNSAHTNGLPA